MAQITIKLRFNKQTGKKDIVVEYESDQDQTGWEHEKVHKRIVEELLGKDVLADPEYGEVIRVGVTQGGGAQDQLPREVEPAAEASNS